MPVKRDKDDRNFFYEGFSAPNGTFVPDDVFDLLAPQLSEAELRVLLYIVRRTFGFGKTADAISLRQLTNGIRTRDGRTLDLGTGMSRKGVIGGLKGLLEKGIITVARGTDDRGENEINIYSLRFKDGVVTNGNHRSNPNTLPGVTGGNPQESLLQKTDSQQQDHSTGNMRKSQSSSSGASVVDPVVVASKNKKSNSSSANKELENMLYETLRDIGVHHHTAAKILREHDQDHVQRLCEYVAHRLEQGWVPQESAAAWVVAAIRKGYVMPQHFKTQREREQQEQSDIKEAEKQAELSRLETEKTAKEVKRHREGRMLSLGIEQNMDKVWQSAQATMREQGTWSVAMPMCFLKSLENDVAVLLVPQRIRNRINEKKKDIAGALTSIKGNPVEIIVRGID